MNCQETVVQQGLQEIAKVFYNERKARALLAKAQMPIAQVPRFDGTPIEFWESVCEEIEHGLVGGGPERLLSSAADIYPYNSVFG
ncbi:MAG: effector-associated domain EAD1-containing protein, partial [Candidatus Parabeggiatoa sp.]|nr:effector-associated domain EAD1-containing protein [Candidatus Parabeggiatoa sp.]